MANIKSPEDIEQLRAAGKLHARILSELSSMVAPGVTTQELNDFAEKSVRDAGDIPSFLKYKPEGALYPYPASLCVSVNDEIVHGIPGGRVLAEGDVVGMDFGVTHNNLITDAAITVAVGEIDEKVKKLLSVTRGALYAGIDAAVFGNRVGDISNAIAAFAKKNGYGIVKDLGGHGVGHHVHEDPYIPNYGKAGTGPLLRAGMVLALEPMFTLGNPDIEFAEDGYTIVTKDHSVSAHFEHTILITKKEAEVLTEE